MTKIKIDSQLSKGLKECDTILGKYDELETLTKQLEKQVESSKWNGAAREKYIGVCKLTVEYQDDIRFLYEQLKVHVDQLLKQSNQFVSKSKVVKKLEE